MGAIAESLHLTALKRPILRIASALQSFAEEKGWAPEDYQTYVRVNQSAGRIHIIFVARGFEGTSDFARYAEVRSYLENKLKDATTLFQAIGLVVRTPRQVAEGGIYAIGPDYIEVGKPPAQ
jgi:hypothetical protein